MSPENLSRRSMMTAAVSIGAVAAVPASLAAAIPLAIVPSAGPANAVQSPEPVTAITKPSLIAKLWARREKLKLQYRAVHKKLEKVERDALRPAGKPDPAILYTKKNDALGLAYVGAKARNPNRRLGAYIWPHHIQRELGKLEPTVGQVLALMSRPFRMTKKRIAKREKLKALLKIAQAYDNKVRSIEQELGSKEIDEKLSAIADAQGRIECRILRIKSTSRADFKIKFAICPEDPGFAAPHIAHELRRFAMTGDKAALAFAA
jgi:hypothetical protein